MTQLKLHVGRDWNTAANYCFVINDADKELVRKNGFRSRKKAVAAGEAEMDKQLRYRAAIA